LLAAGIADERQQLLLFGHAYVRFGKPAHFFLRQGTQPILVMGAMYKTIDKKVRPIY
jgi:hypothetical protein